MRADQLYGAKNGSRKPVRASLASRLRFVSGAMKPLARSLAELCVSYVQAGAQVARARARERAELCARECVNFPLTCAQ